jgi:outer membrane lipopolysaccharide assembly protein LptE/RlpB
MKHLKKIFLLILLSVTLSFVSGCGYQLGSIMHPQVKSIAIAPIKNETLEPKLAAYLRHALTEQFQLDGSVKLKQKNQADAIMYARIIKVVNRGTGEDSWDDGYEYNASEWTITVTVEFKVIIPGRVKPLISTRQITQSATYQSAADQFVSRHLGALQACRNASETMVQYTVEAW